MKKLFLGLGFTAFLSFALISCSDDDHAHCHCDLVDGTGDIEFDVHDSGECEEFNMNPEYENCHMH